jgi:hypothetical protein
MKEIEKFVCHLYQPKPSISEVKELRWFLFKPEETSAILEIATITRRFT